MYGNVAFPREGDRADVATPRGDPIAAAVNDEEERGQAGRDRQRPNECRSQARSSESGAARDRDAKHPPLIDLHLDLLEPGPLHELVHFRGRATAHDPRLAFAIAQNARDEFQLRMPGLVGVNQMAARLDGVGQSGERFRTSVFEGNNS